MLTVFGRLRRQLIEEGHLMKYLAYGLGEVFLILIGILLAVEVSEWNDERLHHQEQIVLIERLLAAVKRDQEIPIASVTTTLERTIDTLREINQDFHAGTIPIEREYAFIMHSTDPRSIVDAEFAELRGQITDKEVGAQLGNYLAFFDSVAQYYQVRTKDVLLQLSRQIDELLEHNFSEGYGQFNGTFDESVFMEKYNSDERFRGTIYRLFLNSRTSYEGFSQLRKFSERLVSQLEEKLAKMKTS